MIDSMFSCT